MQKNVIFEHPLNERIRVFLRLEWFFKQLEHFQQGLSTWDAVSAIQAFLEILAILERNDIRSEVTKELDRHITSLQRLTDTPQVDRYRLEETIAKLQDHFKIIYSSQARISPDLKENELITSLRQRMAITGGCLSFDIPTYNLWLQKDKAQHKEDFKRWSRDLVPLGKAIMTLLDLTRTAGLFESKTTSTNGLYQKVLDPQAHCQIVRISVPAKDDIFPEISASRHRINVRFLHFTEKLRPLPVQSTIEFAISCCLI